jgi:hypothetical protein
MYRIPIDECQELSNDNGILRCEAWDCVKDAVIEIQVMVGLNKVPFFLCEACVRKFNYTLSCKIKGPSYSSEYSVSKIGNEPGDHQRFD